jgi:hypothetical protein
MPTQITVLVCRACYGKDEEESMEATVSPLDSCWVCRRPVDPDFPPGAREARKGTYFWVLRYDTGEVLTNPYPRELPSTYSAVRRRADRA